MSAKFKLIIALVVVVLISVLAYSTLQATKVQYKVCMNFRGRTHCAVAQGRTSKEAMRSAQEIDCGLISRDRSQLMVCETTMPQSVEFVPK